MAIKHTFVSTVPDEGTSGKVSPSDWNADHTIEDGSIATAKLATATQQFLVPSGGIIMWSGSIASIPTGWYLCNGSNGTPDLRDKFIVGAKQDASGVAKTNIEGSLKQSAAPTHLHSQTVHSHGMTHTHELVPHYHAIPMFVGTSRIAWGSGLGANPFGDSLAPYSSYSCNRTIASDVDASPDALAYANTAKGAEPDGASFNITNNSSLSATANSSAANTGSTAPIPTYYALAFIQKS